MGYRVPGPVTVAYGNPGVSIGNTKAGVIIRPNTSLVPITEDKRGAAPATYLFGGKSAIVEVIGLQPGQAKLANLWGSNLLKLGNTVGTLASVSGNKLTITERDGTSIWIADKAFPVDPRELGFRSTQEQLLPLMFVIVMVSGKLFSTVPAYLTT